MEQTSKTTIEQVETEEQKTKRRVPIYYLIQYDMISTPSGVLVDKFATKKDLKDYLESHDSESRNPIVILGHEVPLTFNKIVKVDF
jgi:hypothetical protein